MAKVVNLNHFRKQQTHVADKARADENAVQFGRSKAVKNRETAKAAKAKNHLDGHKTEP